MNYDCCVAIWYLAFVDSVPDTYSTLLNPIPPPSILFFFSHISYHYIDYLH